MTQSDQEVKSKDDDGLKKTQRRLFGRHTKRYLFTKHPVRNQKNGFWRYLRGIEAPLNNGKELDAISHSLYVRMISAAGYMTHNYGLIPGTLEYWAERLSVTRKQIKTALNKLIKIGLIKRTGETQNSKRFVVNYSLFREGSFDQDKADEFFVSLATEGQIKCETGPNVCHGKTAPADVLSDLKNQTGPNVLQNRAKTIEENRINNDSDVNELMVKEINNITNITCKHGPYKFKTELQELADNELLDEHFEIDGIDIVNVILLQASRLAQHTLNSSGYHIAPDKFMTLLLNFEDSINCGERDISDCKTGQDYVSKFRGVLVTYARAQRDKQYPAYATEQVQILT